ncbi:hypothetical protein P153DRAFT_390463 [Dothidotthia symphoricarpi CBS 119687]|uniref:Uncharacterized protein n=1 Tax=Dothidotthia symphoricarpi CBS 119687 TaxID=1392245 RepID=A0A6A6A1I5_9PLEO|nr:uncharacterized protein P153DRAFT_390463 [Dothidotthia symphoricarpi CBS 119687]KAF2124421.1 hypothetical protein P153DRAFT_390463 [Dothidotthia symphoricarpi CBS 119687]
MEAGDDFLYYDNGQNFLDASVSPTLQAESNLAMSFDPSGVNYHSEDATIACTEEHYEQAIETDFGQTSMTTRANTNYYAPTSVFTVAYDSGIALHPPLTNRHTADQVPVLPYEDNLPDNQPPRTSGGNTPTVEHSSSKKRKTAQIKSSKDGKAKKQPVIWEQHCCPFCSMGLARDPIVKIKYCQVFKNHIINAHYGFLLVGSSSKKFKCGFCTCLGSAACGGHFHSTLELMNHLWTSHSRNLEHLQWHIHYCPEDDQGRVAECFDTTFERGSNEANGIRN